MHRSIYHCSNRYPSYCLVPTTPKPSILRSRVVYMYIYVFRYAEGIVR